MNLREAGALALELMRKYNLPDGGWRFRWNRAKTTYGMCSYRRQTIFLSKPLTLANDVAQVRDTILHEIAHALAGAKDRGHGSYWKLMAVQVGAKPERCGNGVGVKGRYRGVCQDCGHEFFRFKRPRNRFLETGYHTECRRRGKQGRLTWYDGSIKLGVVKVYSPVPVPEQPIFLQEPEPMAAKEVSEEPKITQSQILELWERRNRNDEQKMRAPYAIFESLFGAYNPDEPRREIFSVWLGEQKAEYLRQHPEAKRNMIDGHMFDRELQRFFAWLDTKFEVKS